MVGGTGEDHEVAVGFILESDELQVLPFAFEEANQSQEALGLEVDGGELMSIDPKLLSGLDNCILHEEEGMEAKEPGFGNHWGLHVLDEDMSILIFEAEEEGVVSTEHSRVFLHPLHGIFMLLLEAVSNLPVREESPNLQGGENSTISLALGLKVLLPPVTVDNLVSIGQLGELKVVLLIEQGETLVLEHEGSEEEAPFVVHVHLSDVWIIPIGSGSKVSKGGKAVHTNLGKGSQQRVVDNSGKELGCGGCDVFSGNTQSLQVTNGGSNGSIGLVDKWIAVSRLCSLEDEVCGGSNQCLSKLSHLNRSSGRAKGVNMENGTNPFGHGRLIDSGSFLGSDGSHKGSGRASGKGSSGSVGSNPSRTMWEGRSMAASLPSKGVVGSRSSSRGSSSPGSKTSCSGHSGDGRGRPWAPLGRKRVKWGAIGAKRRWGMAKSEVPHVFAGNAQAFCHFPLHVAVVAEAAGVVGHVNDHQALFRSIG